MIRGRSSLLKTTITITRRSRPCADDHVGISPRANGALWNVNCSMKRRARCGCCSTDRAAASICRCPAPCRTSRGYGTHGGGVADVACGSISRASASGGRRQNSSLRWVVELRLCGAEAGRDFGQLDLPMRELSRTCSVLEAQLPSGQVLPLAAAADAENEPAERSEGAQRRFLT